MVTTGLLRNILANLIMVVKARKPVTKIFIDRVAKIITKTARGSPVF